MSNNDNNSINRPINRVVDNYWPLLSIIAIKCQNFIIIYNKIIAIIFPQCYYVHLCKLLSLLTLNEIIVIIGIIQTEVGVIGFNEVYGYYTLFSYGV